MDLQFTDINSHEIFPIYPFINELVDALYTDELNNIIDSDNVRFDKKTFLMFIIMYFVTRLYTSHEEFSKDDIKLFLTNIIRNPEKRRRCIEIFLMFEKNLNEITDSHVNSPKSITEMEK